MVATMTRTFMVFAVAGVVSLAIGGCSSQATNGPAAPETAQSQAYRSPDNALAACDGLGSVVFGDETVRNQVAMLRHGTAAFARAEAEDAIGDIPLANPAVYATVDPASEE